MQYLFLVLTQNSITSDKRLITLILAIFGYKVEKLKDIIGKAVVHLFSFVLSIHFASE